MQINLVQLTRVIENYRNRQTRKHPKHNVFLQCIIQKFQTNESQQLNDLEIVKQSEVIRFELTNYILVLLKSN